MEIASPDFFAFVLVLALVYHLYRSPRYRAWVMAVANAAFVSTFVYWPQQKFFLAWLLGSGYAMAWLVQQRKIRSPFAIGLYVFTLVQLLLVVRVVQYDGASPPPVLLVGYSFLMFKLIHMLVDAAQGRLEGLSPLVYFNYICGFYTWVCGPIQRYQDFSSQMRADGPGPSTEEMVRGLDRVVNGCLKAFVLAPWVAAATTARPLLQNPPPPEFWAYLAVWYYGFYLFLFLDFSGYTDIMIGVAALLGMRLPENFRHPWMSRNLIDFWQRWHLTLSHWLRDYLFHPAYWKLTHLNQKTRWLNAALAYLLTFTVAGVWHGPKMNYLIFALMHGLGAFFNQVGNDVILKALPATWRTRYRKSAIVHGLAVVICATYVALSMLFFGYPLDELYRVGAAVMGRLSH